MTDSRKGVTADCGVGQLQLSCGMVRLKHNPATASHWRSRSSASVLGKIPRSSDLIKSFSTSFAEEYDELAYFASSRRDRKPQPSARLSGIEFEAVRICRRNP